MLVLSRKPGEKVVIGEGITVTVLEIVGNRVRLGIEAPGDVRILRGELACWLDPESRAATVLNHSPTGQQAGA
jgi:carbon storage regulator